MKTLIVGKHKRAIFLSPTVRVGEGAGAEICLELEPEPEISKMGGSNLVFINGLTDSE